MATAPVPRTTWALLLVSGLAVGCGSPALAPIDADGWGAGADLRGNPVGEEPARKPAPRPRAIPVEQRKRWDDAELLASLDSVPGRGPSEHLDAAYQRSVLVNDLAAAYQRLVPGIVFPRGAMVAQRHHRPAEDDVVAWFIMRKGAPGSAPERGDWQFIVLDAQARVAAAEPLDLCARCHGDAAHDWLFGPPTADDEP